MDLFDYVRKSDPPVEIEPVKQKATAPVRVVVKRDKPYIDSDGGLVIPFECDRKYHWWAGGQSLEETLKEIAGD